MTAGTAGPVIVWGNCQAEPLADLLRAPLGRHGYDVLSVPPVYLLDAPTLAHVRDVMTRAAVLITQPVSDDYHLPGCGTASISALLPPQARVITFGVAHHTGAFPYQSNAHGGDGARVLAPVTDYHDLRAVIAAERGMTVAEAAAWWPQPAAGTVQRAASVATTELARRESTLDIRIGAELLQPGALWTMTHPSNALLVRIAQEVLALLEIVETVEAPQREYLGQRRAPIEPAVAAALGWPSSAVRERWVVDGQPRELEDVLEQQLATYAARPDIVTDTLQRQSIRLRQLGLTAAS